MIFLHNKYNFFRHARFEMAHSAFWAWILQHLDNSEQPYEIDTLAQIILNFVGIERPEGEMLAETEVTETINETLMRFDVLLSAINDPPQYVVVEVKRDALLDAAQAEAYKRKTANIFAINLNVFNPLHFTCPVISLDNAYHILSSGTWKNHSLIAEYIKILQADVEAKKEIEQAIIQGTFVPEKCFCSPEFQWLFMEKLNQRIQGTELRLQKNFDGTPHVQLEIVPASENEEQDALFYRLDKAVGGFYVSLKQYKVLDENPRLRDLKMARFSRLQKIWKKCSDGTPVNFEYRKPIRNNEWPVMFCYFTNPNTPEKILTSLPLIHERFMRRLVVY